MIAQDPKPLEEILDCPNGGRKVVSCGRGGCATAFHTGGGPEVGRAFTDAQRGR